CLGLVHVPERGGGAGWERCSRRKGRELQVSCAVRLRQRIDAQLQRVEQIVVAARGAATALECCQALRFPASAVFIPAADAAGLCTDEFQSQRQILHLLGESARRGPVTFWQRSRPALK